MSDLILAQPAPIQRSAADNNQFLIRRYLDWLRVRNMSKHTLRNYARPLQEFAAMLGSTSFLEVKHSDILGFLSDFQGAGVSSHAMFAYCAALRSFGKFLQMLDIPSTGAFGRIRLPKVQSRIGRFHTLEEIEKIISATKTPRERAVIEVFFATGCRVSEVEGMRVEEINWQNRTIKVLGKGDRERIAYFGAPAEKALRKYLGGRTEGSLFGVRSTHLQRLVAEIGSRVGIKSTPHCFRHGFATAMFNNSAGLREVQELLGHQHVTTTARYLHSSVGDLVRIHEKFHPHAGSEAPSPETPRPVPKPPIVQTKPKSGLEYLLDYWKPELGSALDFVAYGNPKADITQLLKHLQAWRALPLQFRKDVREVLRRDEVEAQPQWADEFFEFWRLMTPKMRKALRAES